MAALADDPWGVAMWACAALAGLGLLWALIALAMRARARPAARLLGVGSFGYLATAATSVVLRVSASASPGVAAAAPPAAPDVQVSPADPAVSPAAKPADSEAADPSPAVPDTAAASDAKAPDDAAPPVEVDPGITGPPQRTGREAVRYAGLVAKDDRCTDPRAVAGAVRDLAAAVASEPKARVDKAVDKLEDCRKKIMWVKSASVRRKRVDAREAWVDALKARMRSERTPVFVALRGASHDRIRLGGSEEAIGKLRSQYDATLKQELEGLGFTEVTFANMKDTERFELEVPSDHQLAARELVSLKLDRPIRLEP